MSEKQNAKMEGTVRPALMQDVDQIHHLIGYYAERRKMLFRALEDLYERIREFRVFVGPDNRILGCCGLSILWRDLGEIRSLAVDPNHIGCGIGRQLVCDAIAEARNLGLRQVFALTYESPFFERLGFSIVEKSLLPHKVWTDCIRCEMQNQCREIPVLLDLTK
jgi:amino-acid N-acetyltransferase